MDLLNNLINEKEVLFIEGLIGLNLVVLFFLTISLIKIRRLTKKSKDFFKGKKGKDLEAFILRNVKDIKSLDKDIQELYNISNQINNLTLKSIHKISVVRFNPFKDIGGDQSFSVALLNGKDSGLTMSSLHTREGTRVYVKPITKGKSAKYPLTEEESQAIKSAQEIEKSRKKYAKN